VAAGEAPRFRNGRDLMPQLAGGHELPSGEDAVQQSVFFLERNQNRSIDVEDHEREEHEHQEEVNFAKVLGIDQLRQPADELGQNGIAQHAAVESQAGQDSTRISR
jgi:hypothetical protein